VCEAGSGRIAREREATVTDREGAQTGAETTCVLKLTPRAISLLMLGNGTGVSSQNILTVERQRKREGEAGEGVGEQSGFRAWSISLSLSLS
jgi:hypothetical protein